MSVPLYSVGTWDSSVNGYTPHEGVPAFNLTLPELRRSLRLLRAQGEDCYRFRDREGTYHSDWFVLVERTDGASETEILRRWRRGI